MLCVRPYHCASVATASQNGLCRRHRNFGEPARASARTFSVTHFHAALCSLPFFDPTFEIVYPVIDDFASQFLLLLGRSKKLTFVVSLSVPFYSRFSSISLFLFTHRPTLAVQSWSQFINLFNFIFLSPTAIVCWGRRSDPSCIYKCCCILRIGELSFLPDFIAAFRRLIY